MIMIDFSFYNPKTTLHGAFHTLWELSMSENTLIFHKKIMNIARYINKTPTDKTCNKIVVST